LSLLQRAQLAGSVFVATASLIPRAVTASEARPEC
jgi:hypothetical protein